MWSGPKGASVQERLDRAQEAKKALLERFKSSRDRATRNTTSGRPS